MDYRGVPIHALEAMSWAGVLLTLECVTSFFIGGGAGSFRRAQYQSTHQICSICVTCPGNLRLGATKPSLTTSPLLLLHQLPPVEKEGKLDQESEKGDRKKRGERGPPPSSHRTPHKHTLTYQQRRKKRSNLQVH